MINPADFLQLRAYARIDGLYLALIWTASFACYVAGLSSPTIGIIASLSAMASLFFAAKRLVVFRDNIRGGFISFRRAAAYYILTFFYASVLFAVVQYVYMAFMDNGYLLGTYLSSICSPEAQAILKAYGMTKYDIGEMLTQLQRITPLSFALNVMSMNITIGILLSIPVALVCRKTGKRKFNNQQTQ